MGDRRGAHVVGSLQLAARKRAVAGADLLENLVAARFGQRAGDPRKLPVRQATGFGSSHRFRDKPQRIRFPWRALQARWHLNIEPEAPRFVRLSLHCRHSADANLWLVTDLQVL